MTTPDVPGPQRLPGSEDAPAISRPRAADLSEDRAPAADTETLTAAAAGTRPSRKRKTRTRRRSGRGRAASDAEGAAESSGDRSGPSGSFGIPPEGPKSSEGPGGPDGKRGTGAAPGSAGAEAPARRRRRKTRRGRSAEDSADAPPDTRSRRSEPDTEAEAAGAAAPAERKRRRRRGKRGGRRREAGEAVAVDFIPGEEDLPPLEEAPEEEPAEGGRRGRRTRKKAGAPATRGAQSDKTAKSAKKKSRRSRRKESDSAETVPAPRKAGVPNVILVNAGDPDETRVGVVQDGLIVDFQMTVRHQHTLVNDIYRGRVVNLEPAIGAAFVDFGQGRNGFLHTSDVLSCYGDDDWELSKLLSARVEADELDESSQPEVSAEVDEADGSEDAGGSEETKAPVKNRARSKKRRRGRPRLPITDLLSKGESVVVQVTKDAIGDKGPTLTTYISIPGRFLVLMPSVARTGVSRKIEDEKERRRLKKILKGMTIPEGMGVIVRTAGIGATKTEIKRDLEYLLMIWENFGKRLTLGRGPIALYEESDVAIRTMRDLFTADTEKVVVDDRRVFERMREFTEKLMPEYLDRIEMHEGPRPIFHTYGVEQDFERIFAHRVDLTSGGSIVFDQTEALVAIDVNSGKTRSDGFDFEDVALKTNLEAVPEIARQIRLRDLGGIVVVDFIDMMRMANRRAVERAFRQALAGDRARSKIGRISQFGLLEMTRQRLGAGMSKMLFTNCQRCRGSGRIRTVESRSMAILRRLGSALTLKGFTKVECRAHPEVVEHLKRQHAVEIDALRRRHERQIEFTPVPDQVEDSVLRYLRADGREVRPGGRRKR